MLAVLTSYQRGDVSVSGHTGSISGVTMTQNLGWNPQGALTYNNVNNVTLLDNLGNAQNQNTSNTYNSNGDASSSTNAADEGVNAVYNAWGQPVSYTISQSIQVGTDPTTGTPIYQTFTQTETTQYDALGRPLGEFVNVTVPVSGGSPNTETTQHTFVYDANSGNVIQEINQVDGTDPVRYVYGAAGNVIMRQAGTNGSTSIDQTLYALQDAQGSTVAITDGSGNVVERYVFDGLGNAQALQADGTVYAPDTNPGTSGTPGQQINEYFVGATFGANGNETAAGTQYNWTILYRGETYDALPGVYETANGEFNPRQQSLEAPDLSVIQQGVSAYDPTAGETGFNGWYDRNANTIAGLSETGLGLAGIYLTGGLAELASPFISSALGLSGTAAAGAASVAEETSGTVGALEDWEGANAAARLAARDAAFETDNAANAANTAGNVENTVKRSVVIAKATVGAVSGGISSIVGSIADHGSVGQDILAGALGAAAGPATSGAGAFLRFGIASQLTAGAVGSAGGNLFAQSVSYAFGWRSNIDLSEVATSGVAGAFAPLFSGAAIVDRLLGEESEPLLIYASGLPMAGVEGLTHVGLESLITGSAGLAGTGG